MKYTNPFSVLVVLAGLSVPLPSIAHAAESQAAAPAQTASHAAIRDVALREDHVLEGQVLDRQNLPQAHLLVSLEHQGREVARTRTDAEGRFAIHQLRGGVHVITAGATREVLRIWTSEAAPPAASSRLMLVQDAAVQRGQQPGRAFGNFVRNHGVGAALVAGGVAGIAAVAIDQSSGS